MKRLLLFLVLVLSVVTRPDAVVWADQVPRLDLDVESPRVVPSTLRQRWLFRPADIPAAQARIADSAAELVAQLPRLGDLWILESDLDRVDDVRAEFVGLGELVEDRSGTPALYEATERIGARSYLWNDLALRGDPTSTVAILDSGCDTAHDDLGDPDGDDEGSTLPPGDVDDWADGAGGLPGLPGIRVIAWHDVTDDEPAAVGPWDFHNHGTALASAGFGSGAVDVQRRGVAPEAPLAIVKTWNFEGRWEVWASDLLLGLDWVLANRETYRIRVCLIGASWDAELGMTAAVNALLDVGIVVVAPSGNDSGVEMGWPARLPGVLTVGSCTKDGRLTAYSSPGPSDVGEPRLDVLAPGGGTVELGSDAVWVADNEPDDSYRGRTGTSIAAAQVAGAVNLVSQALVEAGRSWTQDRTQVEWVIDLLRATASETLGSEPGAAAVPAENGLGWDRFEGYGILRVDAAVDAIDRVLLPGRTEFFSLTSIDEGAPVAGFMLPRSSDGSLRIELLPPVEGDFDLYAWTDRGGRLELVAWSATRQTGVPEVLDLDPAPDGRWVVVVKRARGSGIASLRAIESVGDSERWPVQVDDALAASPGAGDLDGDGALEVLAVSNVLNDSSHRFYAWNAQGSAMPGFPQEVFSENLVPGELRSPIFLQTALGPRVIATSDFGQIFAVDANGGDVWAGNPRVLTPGAALGDAVGWRVGAGDWAAFTTSTGILAVDGSGAVVLDVDLGEPSDVPLAVGDLDGDGDEDLVVVTASGVVHALDSSGSALAGWPVTIGSGCGPAVLLGDGSGSGANAVYLGRVDAGELRLVALDRVGVAQTISGTVLRTGGTVLRASAPVLASREWDRPLELLFSSLYFDAGGVLRLGLDRVDLGAGTSFAQDLPLAAVSHQAGFLVPNRPWVEEPRVMAFGGATDREVLLRHRVGWLETGLVPRVRYGSVDGIVSFESGGPSRRDRFAVARGHQSILEDLRVGSLGADLDGDGAAELVVGIGDRLHVFAPRVRGDATGAWLLPRGDVRRSACVGCGVDFAVDRPAQPVPAALRIAPNPFNPVTVAILEGVGAGPVEWTLFDARGRRVRRWQSTSEGGAHRERIEGLDDAGTALASGVYHLRARSAQREVGARLVLVR